MGFGFGWDFDFGLSLVSALIFSIPPVPFEAFAVRPEPRGVADFGLDAFFKLLVTEETSVPSDRPGARTVLLDIVLILLAIYRCFAV